MDRMDGRHRGCVWGFQCIVRKADVGVWENVGAVVCARGMKESGNIVLGSRGSIVLAQGWQRVVGWVAGECGVRGRKEVSAF